MANAREVSEADREVLAFLAEHRFARSTHIQHLLRVGASAANRRLASLAERGYISSPEQQHPYEFKRHQITRPGLRAIGSPLPAPKPIEEREGELRHDVGLAWLWLAARDGAFGPLRAIHAERAIRSHDQRLTRAASAGAGGRGGGQFRVSSFGFGPAGGARHHYPDLVLETESGHRVAVELELTAKGATRLDGILRQYRADRSFDVVLYLTDDDRCARNLIAAARRVGMEDRVQVQRTRLVDRAGAAPRGADRARQVSRAPARGGTRSRQASRTPARTGAER